MRRLAARTTLALIAGAIAVPASAHALLEAASPRVGSRGPAPAEVRLTFSEPVEAGFSSVAVNGPAGFGGAAEAVAAPHDRHVLVAALKRPLPAGVYQVRWRVLSTDSHVTQGAFRFEVAP